MEEKKKPSKQIEPLHGVKETAKILKLAESPTYEYVRKGILPHVRIPAYNAEGDLVRYNIRFRPSDIQEFIENHIVQASR